MQEGGKDKELVIGDGTHDSYIYHKFKLRGIEFKTSDFIYLGCSGWSHVSPKKIYKLKSCSDFYRDCH